MKVALLSINFSLSFDERIEKIKELTKTSVAYNAKLLLLPELSYCGYSTDENDITKHYFDDGVRFFCSLAKKYEINIGFGAAKSYQSKYKNV